MSAEITMKFITAEPCFSKYVVNHLLLSYVRSLSFETSIETVEKHQEISVSGNSIQEKNKNGYFIVRKSDTSTGFALTFFWETTKGKGEVKHIKIQLDDTLQRWKLGKTDQHFVSVVDLVEHYMKKGIKSEDGQIFEIKKPFVAKKLSLAQKIWQGKHYDK